MPLNKELLDILACPKCKSELEFLATEDGLKCPKCDVVYPIRDDIPIMLVDEAVPTDTWEESKK